MVHTKWRRRLSCRLDLSGFAFERKNRDGGDVSLLLRLDNLRAQLDVGVFLLVRTRRWKRTQTENSQ